MFLKELIKEVYLSIVRHKVRSLLTGIGITWGILILIVLLGIGNGFRAGTLNLFEGYASNSIWVAGSRTTKAISNGLPKGTRIRFNDDILQHLNRKFSQIESISPEIPLEGSNLVIYKDQSERFNVKGIGKDYLKIKLLEIDSGRALNNIDYYNQRRCVIIGEGIKDVLFENEDPIGKYINISGVFFQIVGTLKTGTIYSLAEQSSIYIPDISLLNTFNMDRNYLTFGMLLQENTDAESFERELRAYLAQHLGFDKDDRKALRINNVQLQVKAFNSLFKGMNIFLWILGLCFLLSGMIGVTNIMLVVVKERTVEIGIRKAIGATPDSILQLIIAESLTITVFFGIIGLLFGYIGIELYNWILSAISESTEEAVFANASIDSYVVILAFIFLVLAGVLAGIFPARKAAKIMPIETLNKVN